MFNRQLRSILPIANTPSLIPGRKPKNDLIRQGQDLPELKQGDIIRFRKEKA